MLFKCLRPASVFETATKPSPFAHFRGGAESLAPATQNHILTSKSAPRPSVFNIFDLEMCFELPRRSLFEHLNFQKCSENAVFCTFWLRNVLGAKAPGTFWTSELPKVDRTWCVLYILTSTCASRHNGVHFFDISTSKSVPTMTCFVHFGFEISKCTSRRNGVQFSPPISPDCSAPAALASLLFGSHKTLVKHSVSRLFYLFAQLHLLSSDSFSSLMFFLLTFSSLTLPTSAFPSVHIVGSLTSKLQLQCIYVITRVHLDTCHY